jgi:cytoskeletal protein CcmA (bactofilin family)
LIMEDKDKSPDSAGSPNGNAAVNVTDAQKSDKSPEELMAQVNQTTDSLEGGPKTSAVDAMADESNADPSQKASTITKKPEPKGFKKLLGKFNIYFVGFLFLLVLAGTSFGVFYYLNKRETNIKLETTELTEEAIEELKTSDVVVGDPKQILTIESHAVISGKVVMRDTLDIAGGLRVGGPLSVPSLGVAGDGSFENLTLNDLQAAGDVVVGGILDVAGAATLGGDLSIAGAINAGGQLDVGGQATIGGNLNVNGTISALGINFDSISVNHINISGSQPSIGVGGAAGGGATASVSGTDTAGTATINTGGGTGTGILGTITFATGFSGNPHPVITPNGSGCANIAYYVTAISVNQFAIASATAPPAGTTCRFNYIVIN